MLAKDLISGGLDLESEEQLRVKAKEFIDKKLKEALSLLGVDPNLVSI